MSALAAVLLAALQDPQGDAERHEIVLVAPVLRFQDAIPLGTGRLGVLVRAEGSSVFLALDRPEVRAEPTGPVGYLTWNRLVAFVAEGKPDRIDSMVRAEPVWVADEEPNVARIDLPPGHAVQRLRADLATGDLVVECAGASLRIHAPLESEFVLVEANGTPFSIVGEESSGAGGTRTFLCPRTTTRARIVGARTAPDAGGLAALTLVDATGAPDPLPGTFARAARLVGTGFAVATARSRQRWQLLTETSSVRLPEARLQALYDLARFLLVAGSQPVGVPLGTAGPWYAAAGGPFETVYEGMFATPASYLGYHALGIESVGEPLFAWLVQSRDAFRSFAKVHFDCPGLLVPGKVALDGSARGSEIQALAPTSSVWFVHAFWSHWRHTLQRGFLEDTAYPWCREVGVALESLLASRGGAPPRLPIARTPPPHTGWCDVIASPSTQDVALLRWLFGALATMALELGEREDVRRWQRMLDRLEPLERDPKTAALLLAHGVPYSPANGTFGHAAAIHPLGLVAVESSAEQRKTVLATLGAIEQAGADTLTGLQLAWYAALCARADQGEAALAALHRFERTAVSRSGLHLLPAEPPLRGTGPAVRKFALAGNLLLLEAVHQMLLRSQSGIVQVFPAVPASWKDLAFTDLRAEGAVRVSARREHGKTVVVTLRAEKGGIVKLADPFPGKAAVWSGEVEPKRTGWGYELALRAGESITASAR